MDGKLHVMVVNDCERDSNGDGDGGCYGVDGGAEYVIKFCC